MKDAVANKLSELGLTLPAPAAAKGNYLPYSITGKVVYLSGALPIKDGAIACAGKVGQEQTIESGYLGAQLCTLNALAYLSQASDGFANLSRIVHVEGFVNGVDGFPDSPKVVNGASDLLADLFGEAGRHSRIAVSVNGLPLNAAVEIHIVAELK